MFNKKAEIGHKWNPVSSQIKALFHCAGKEEVAYCKLQKTRRVYIKERTEQRERLNKGIAGLDRLLKESSIDEETYGRLKKLLEIGYKQKRQETREMCGFAKKLDENRTTSEF